MKDKNKTALEIIVRLRDGDSLTDDERQSLQARLAKLCLKELKIISGYRGFQFTHNWSYEDFCQDVLEKLFNHGYEKYDETRAQFFTWFNTVSLNVYLTHYRKERGKLETVPMDCVWEDGSQRNVIDSIRHTESAEDRFCRTENRQQLRMLFEKLPPNYRNAIELHDLQGFKSGEVAKQLGVNSHDISNWLGRGHDSLRKAIEREPDELAEALLHDLTA